MTRLRVSRRLWIGAAALLAAGGLGALGYVGLVRLGLLHYNRWDRRERGELRVGGVAPDLALALYSGGSIRLSQFWGDKPVVLVFGSCT